ncbi:hypothetical protein VTO42DRAFT_6909 [Malbranchea cinnamomea]
MSQEIGLSYDEIMTSDKLTFLVAPHKRKFTSALRLHSCPTFGFTFAEAYNVISLYGAILRKLYDLRSSIVTVNYPEKKLVKFVEYCYDNTLRIGGKADDLRMLAVLYLAATREKWKGSTELGNFFSENRTIAWNVIKFPAIRECEEDAEYESSEDYGC